MRSEFFTLLPTTLADRYRVERELGRGGMAVVYLAEDLKHGRKVAVKILKPEIAAAIGAERFVREIRTSAALQHPHILGLIDSGETGGTAYYVMPLVEGENLRERLRREKQLPVSDAVRITSEVASALDYAHRRGIIHRDIKPENILLQDGQALVADFGIALGVTNSTSETRITEAGLSLGTPHYMSPEQAMGERELTARSDVYALGCVTYEMLAGDPPFTGPTPQAIVARMLTELPASVIARRSTVPVAIEKALLTALQKLPADRFASTTAFSAALAASETGTVRHVSAATPLAAPAVRSLASGGLRLSEDTCRRMSRASFDPRLIGSTLHYLDNQVQSDVLVCYIPACGRAANQYTKVLETASYRAVAVTFRGFEPVSPWRPALPLDDHMVIVREFLRDAVARLKPRLTIIAGFSSGADFAIRFAAQADPEPRLQLDGCLSLGANLSTSTCFLTSVLATLKDRDDEGLLQSLRRVANGATTLDEWVNICDYIVHVVPTFRDDVAPLRRFGTDISAPFADGTLTPFVDWYRAATGKQCRVRCIFEDTPMFRDLVREMQLRNLDEAWLGPAYEEGSIVADAGTGHFDLIDPPRVEEHVRALVDRLSR
jgi:serine/threonine protein kinase